MIYLNSLYCMDNLVLLRQLPNDYIDLIYCDILYGTGKNFGEYQDLDCDRETIESHYLPRLIEMKRILKESGSIYLQMDTRINHWVRCLLDDIFGSGNFRNEIVWCYGAGDVNAKNRFCRVSDRILFYAKSDKGIFNIAKDGNGKKVKDWWQILSFGQKMFNKGFFEFHNDEEVFYITQKPKMLLERIIKASSNEGDIVADFYLGSGTTCVVAKELGRNYIGCDINENAVKIAEKRLDFDRVKNGFEDTFLRNFKLGNGGKL